MCKLCCKLFAQFWYKITFVGAKLAWLFTWTTWTTWTTSTRITSRWKCYYSSVCRWKYYQWLILSYFITNCTIQNKYNWSTKTPLCSYYDWNYIESYVRKSSSLSIRLLGYIFSFNILTQCLHAQIFTLLPSSYFI